MLRMEGRAAPRPVPPTAQRGPELPRRGDQAILCSGGSPRIAPATRGTGRGGRWRVSMWRLLPHVAAPSRVDSCLKLRCFGPRAWPPGRQSRGTGRGVWPSQRICAAQAQLRTASHGPGCARIHDCAGAHMSTTCLPQAQVGLPCQQRAWSQFLLGCKQFGTGI